MTLVNLTVTDPLDRLVTGLEKEHFRVFEDGTEQEVLTLSSEDVPVSIGLVFDMSGSMSDKVEKAREAAVQFMRTANPMDQFFLVSFNDRAELTSGFTSSVDELQNRMMFTASKGRTALLDAILKHAKMFSLEPCDEAVQWIRDREVHQGHADINFDPLSCFDLWFGGFLRRLDRALRLAKCCGRDQGAHNKSGYAETIPFSSCHHRIACLRRRCRAVTAGSDLRTLQLFYHPAIPAQVPVLYFDN